MLFFIENEDVMASRINGKISNLSKIPQKTIDRKTIILLSIFQYFIGNTDWSVPALHNIKIVSKSPYEPLFAIPYDFDWSGIVNSAYAIPDEKLGLTTVRERLYRGFQYQRADYEEAFLLFKNKKDLIYKLYNEFPYLSKKQKKSSISYIDRFYKIIENENLQNAIFIKGARK